jgi:hypothetical protein
MLIRYCPVDIFYLGRWWDENFYSCSSNDASSKF